jgi:hypothetical protein
MHITVLGESQPAIPVTERLQTCTFDCMATGISNKFTAIHSFHWHVQNVPIPYRSQQLLPFLSVIHPFLPPFSTNKSSILPSILWSTTQSYCTNLHTNRKFNTTIQLHEKVTISILQCEKLHIQCTIQC